MRISSQVLSSLKAALVCLSALCVCERGAHSSTLSAVKWDDGRERSQRASSGIERAQILPILVF